MENVDIEKIDNYLQGNLSIAEAQQFEKELASNPTLQKNVAEQRGLIAGMKAFEEKRKFMEMMGEIKAEKSSTHLSAEKEEGAKIVTMSEKKSNRFGLRRVLAIAASVALLIAAMVFFNRPQQDTTLLAQQNFEQYEDKMTARFSTMGAAGGTEEALLSSLKTGIAAYNDGDLATAKQNFNDYIIQATKRDYMSMLTDFYLAQIALSENNYSESVQLLSPLAKENGLPIGAAVNWYLALAHLGNSDKNAALPLLKKIPASDELAAKAQKLIKDLEN